MDTLITMAGLKPWALPPSLILNQRKDIIVKLLLDWKDNPEIFAENFFPDESIERRRAASLKIFSEAGEIKNITQLKPENQLRGSFILEGENKNIMIFFTLTPEKAALIQQLDIEFLNN